ncbi:MAG: hypothetical protein Ct9H90mP16_15010 [Candidatus Poseidoniales archaeon]|nr:MAG: hypothetical protein Ct9H90mP16_15010 [Candidatus Poseidoniales archaeon]
MDNYYDERSHIDKALGTYNGSIYWVQGLQDWNVDPHQVFGGPPGVNWYQEYIDNGLRSRGMIGQWEHKLSRSMDQAQQSGFRLRWRSHPQHDALGLGTGICLNGSNITSKESAQLQPCMRKFSVNDGEWRIEETWPPHRC